MNHSRVNHQSTSPGSVEEGLDAPRSTISGSSLPSSSSQRGRGDTTAAIARSRLEILSKSSFSVGQVDQSSRSIHWQDTATVTSMDLPHNVSCRTTHTGTSSLSSSTRSSTEDHNRDVSAKGDPAMAAAMFHGRCEEAAWRIQASFRDRRKRLGTNPEEETSIEGENAKGHETDSISDCDTRSSSPSSLESGEEPDKPEVDRSNLYLAAFIAFFSCTIFILRQIKKLFGNEDESEDLAQEVGNNVMEETGAHMLRDTVVNTASGGAGGGAPGGSPP